MLRQQRRNLKVLGLDLEVALRVLADGALLGGLGADLDVAAHGAHPHLHFLAAEHLVVLDALDEQLVAVLVALLDGGQALEEVGQIGEALLAGGFGIVGVDADLPRPR